MYFTIIKFLCYECNKESPIFKLFGDISDLSNFNNGDHQLHQLYPECVLILIIFLISDNL
jgi:hypothetical protein